MISSGSVGMIFFMKGVHCFSRIMTSLRPILFLVLCCCHETLQPPSTTFLIAKPFSALTLLAAVIQVKWSRIFAFSRCASLTFGNIVFSMEDRDHIGAWLASSLDAFICNWLR
eukprot:GDKK01064576.1.p3 GENE.GDKK01064576.1~~GDKK01064576.1.p3  ORF type:complete len:113 (+),score=13.42 GDKK01064576.1:202-540(+)